MIDEYGKALEFCFFLCCADDPIGGHPLVPRGLRTEELPGGFARAKLLLLFTSELGALALFVRVDARLFCATCGKSLEAGGAHQPLLGKISNEVDVNGPPIAGCLEGGEGDFVARFVNTPSNPLAPSHPHRYL